MTLEPITYSELAHAREKLVLKIHKDLTNQERKFILSFKQGDPKWDLAPVAGIQKLPALQWKLKNIKMMKSEKHKKALKN